MIMILTVLILLVSHFVPVFLEIHVGTYCAKNEDCLRYCAYSKYGPEGTSCCFPEKIRISKSNWLTTGSKTCYCCPANSDTLSYTGNGNVLFTPDNFGMTKNNATEDACLGYLTTTFGHEDVTNEFCKSGKCIQAMMVMKLSFEYPSVCRSRKLPINKN